MIRFAYMILGGLLVALMVSLVPALSQDGGMDGDEAEEGENPQEAWMRLQQPGPEHEWLAKEAGEWTIKAKMWMEGQDEPIEMDGTSTTKMMWGRYLHEDFTLGEMHGMGMVGFDNSSREFRMVYIGAWSTGMNIFSGTRSDDGKTVTAISERVEKGLGGMKVRERVVTTRKSDDESVMEMYGKYGDAPERKTMEMTYTRKK